MKKYIIKSIIGFIMSLVKMYAQAVANARHWKDDNKHHVSLLKAEEKANKMLNDLSEEQGGRLNRATEIRRGLERRCKGFEDRIKELETEVAHATMAQEGASLRGKESCDRVNRLQEKCEGTATLKSYVLEFLQWFYSDKQSGRDIAVKISKLAEAVQSLGKKAAHGGPGPVPSPMPYDKVTLMSLGLEELLTNGDSIDERVVRITNCYNRQTGPVKPLAHTNR